MEFLLSPLILIALVLFVAWPLLTNKSEPETVRRGELELAQEEKEGLLATLKDIEMDYRMGKLSEEDYRHLKEDFEVRAVKALQRLEKLERHGPRKRP